MRTLPQKTTLSLDCEKVLALLKEEDRVQFSPCSFQQILVLRNYIHRKKLPVRLSHALIRDESGVRGYTLRLREQNA